MSWTAFGASLKVANPQSQVDCGAASNSSRLLPHWTRLGQEQQNADVASLWLQPHLECMKLAIQMHIEQQGDLYQNERGHGCAVPMGSL
jgi:hypothetical protein